MNGVGDGNSVTDGVGDGVNDVNGIGNGVADDVTGTLTSFVTIVVPSKMESISAGSKAGCGSFWPEMPKRPKIPLNGLGSRTAC